MVKPSVYPFSSIYYNLILKGVEELLIAPGFREVVDILMLTCDG